MSLDLNALKSNEWVDLGPSSTECCPYLKDRQSRLAYGLILPDATRFDQLLAQGHRRIGVFIYRPECPAACLECQPIRVPVMAFAKSRSQRRVWTRNEDRYSVTVSPPHFDSEQFSIYARHAKHVSADNRIGTPESYISSFVQSCVRTHFLEYRLDDKLIAVSIVDESENALSSMYCYWDPDHSDASPGTFSALWEIEWARKLGKDHYYLGYWVRGCSRMNYKDRFRPFELLDWSSGQWNRHSSLL